jgi:endonuclease-3
MAQPNRAALLTKMHKVLKKHYKPVAIPERTVLEHLLYACCLENAHYEQADKAFAAVSTSFFDWNEVRVSTVKELAEVMNMLPDPQSAAANLKRALQGVFESTYSFDLEPLKKQNLGQAQQRLKKLEGTTPFTIAYLTQATLGGHAIPLDRGLMQAFAIFGLASGADKAAGVVPGLERAIPKNKGVEFASLAHQLAAELIANPYSPSLHKTLLEIAPDAKDHLPKRPAKGAKLKAPEPSQAPSAARKETKTKVGETDSPVKGSAAKKMPAPPDKKTSSPKKPSAPERAAAKKPVDKKKSAAAGISKRKPR